MAGAVVPCVVPNKFRLPMSFSFPKWSFGFIGLQRLFRSEWCQKFEWLHFDVATDTAYCHLCLCVEFEKHFLSSTKRDPAFTSRGYTNWKDAKAAFTQRIGTACHREAVQSDSLQKQTGDICEQLSGAHSAENTHNREMLLRILQSICSIFGRQGLPCMVVTVAMFNTPATSHSFYVCEHLTAQLWLNGWTRKWTSTHQGTFRMNCFR